MPAVEVLFADDDVGSPDFSFSVALAEHGFTIAPIARAEDLGTALDAHPNARVLIQNMQMPLPPGVSPRETEYCTFTGLWTLRRHKQAIEVRRMPVVILTGGSKRVLRQLLNEDGEKYPYGGHMTILGKLDVPAAFLPSAINRLLLAPP